MPRLALLGHYQNPTQHDVDGGGHLFEPGPDLLRMLAGLFGEFVHGGHQERVELAVVLEPAWGFVVPDDGKARVNQEGLMVIDLGRAVDRLAVVVPRLAAKRPPGARTRAISLRAAALSGAKRRESMPKTPRAELASSGWTRRSLRRTSLSRPVRGQQRGFVPHRERKVRCQRPAGRPRSLEATHKPGPPRPQPTSTRRSPGARPRSATMRRRNSLRAVKRYGSSSPGSHPLDLSPNAGIDRRAGSVENGGEHLSPGRFISHHRSVPVKWRLRARNAQRRSGAFPMELMPSAACRAPSCR